MLSLRSGLILLFVINALAQNPQASVDKVFKTYIQQVSKGSVSPGLVNADLESLVKSDRSIYKVCAQKKCSIQTQIKEMSHEKGVWRVVARITYKDQAGKTQSFPRRQGCYIVRQGRIDSYINDCFGR
jgi:hypothetical protein